jgi:hypothetical protein
MKKFKELFTQATDEALALSRFDCHIKGLHSIVLANDDGKLTRIFMTTVDHEMYQNLNIANMDMSLGVHTHRYPIMIEGVCGVAVNAAFEETIVGCGLPVKKYFYKDKDKFSFIRDTALVHNGLQAILPETKLFLDETELHTVYVPKGSKSAWLVTEGATVSNSTYLYTNREVKATEFETMSPKAVRRFVKQWFDL